MATFRGKCGFMLINRLIIYIFRFTELREQIKKFKKKLLLKKIRKNLRNLWQIRRKATKLKRKIQQFKEMSISNCNNVPMRTGFYLSVIFTKLSAKHKSGNVICE